MHSDPDKKCPDKFQQGPWGDVPLSAERAAVEASAQWSETKQQFYKDDGPVPVAFSQKEPLYWNEVERRFKPTPVSDMVHRGPPSGIRLEPAEPRERTVGYWEAAYWNPTDGVLVGHHAPEEPKDVDSRSNIMLSCGVWEPMGNGLWRRYCTMTYTPAVAS